MKQYGFYFDQSRCYACHACSLACKDWNLIGLGPEKWLTVYEWEEGPFLSTRINALAFSCGHCEEPACINACPQNAIFKEGKYGAVLVDKEKCDGCRKCAEACPYGSPKFAAEDAKMSKCTMCIDRLEQGELPICVSSCPMRAFDFGPLEELIAKYGEERTLIGMPDGNITKPAFIVKPHDEKKDLIPFDKEKVIQLMQKRGELGNVFEDIRDIMEDNSELIGRRKLKMKHDSAEELMEATQNDMG